MDVLGLVPIIVINGNRTPAYISFRLGIDRLFVCNWSAMDYGFMPTMLVLMKGIDQTQIDLISAKTDVFIFPQNLDQPISDYQTIRPFFESISIPADWLTASTTYRELLRNLAGIFQFSERYAEISGTALLGPGVTLDTRFRDLTNQEQIWFEETLSSFGYTGGINPNQTFRQMLKQVGDAWIKPFFIGGFEF